MQTYKIEIIARKIGMETCKMKQEDEILKLVRENSTNVLEKLGCMDEILKDIDEILEDNDVKMNILCVTFSMCYAPHLKF